MFKKYHFVYKYSTFSFAQAWIRPSASITKLKFAYTRHMVTSLSFSNPKFARRTLFVFSTFDKFLKFTVVLAISVANFKFGTSHIDMKLAFAFKAITIFADRTNKYLNMFIKDINCWAICSGTP